MTISAQPIASFIDFSRSRALRWAFAAALLVPFALPASAAAATRVIIVRPGSFDGIWNVMFSTMAGDCSSNSFPFTVAGTRVSSAGGGKVTGGVSRAGIVSVQISVGASKAAGSGRLAGSSGAGRWSGIIQGDRCSGTWQATRS